MDVIEVEKERKSVEKVLRRIEREGEREVVDERGETLTENVKGYG